jgi:hypothetical protein
LKRAIQKLTLSTLPSTKLQKLNIPVRMTFEFNKLGKITQLEHKFYSISETRLGKVDAAYYQKSLHYKRSGGAESQAFCTAALERKCTLVAPEASHRLGIR